MAIDDPMARDAAIRQAAFDHVRALQSRDLVLSHEDIGRGFMFEGERWPLWNPQRGIFKPRGMPFLLSIRTVFPRKGGRVWYDDQRQVHQQIYAGEDVLDYAFMGKEPSAADNVWLREAAERQIPLIYFLGVSPGRYQAIVPTFVVDWEPAPPDRALHSASSQVLQPPPQLLTKSSAATPSAWSSSGCIRRASGTAFSPPTITGVRSATFRKIISWTPPTSL